MKWFRRSLSTVTLMLWTCLLTSTFLLLDVMSTLKGATDSITFFTTILNTDCHKERQSHVAHTDCDVGEDSRSILEEPEFN